MCCTCTLNRPFNYRPWIRTEVFDDVIERNRGDKAQIKCARHRQMGFGLKLMPTNMEIDFLIAKAKGDAITVKNLHFHNFGIKCNRRVRISAGQYDMVHMVNHGSGSFGLFFENIILVSRRMAAQCPPARLIEPAVFFQIEAPPGVECNALCLQKTPLQGITAIAG